MSSRTFPAHCGYLDWRLLTDPLHFFLLISVQTCINTPPPHTHTSCPIHPYFVYLDDVSLSDIALMNKFYIDSVQQVLKGWIFILWDKLYSFSQSINGISDSWNDRKKSFQASTSSLVSLRKSFKIVNLSSVQIKSGRGILLTNSDNVSTLWGPATPKHWQSKAFNS